jgi:hypothetical protein
MFLLLDSRLCEEKLPDLSTTGDEGADRSKSGEGGTSRTFVVQSMTRTRLVLVREDGLMVGKGAGRKSSRK